MPSAIPPPVAQKGGDGRGQTACGENGTGHRVRRKTGRQSVIGVFYFLSQSMKGDLPMQSTPHQHALEAKHATLDRRIAEETNRPLPDTATIAELKKQKLRLKEEIISL